MKQEKDLTSVFYRIFTILGTRDEEVTARLFHLSGEAVTRFDPEWPLVWPIDSSLSAYYEHPDGITISMARCKELGIKNEFD